MKWFLIENGKSIKIPVAKCKKPKMTMHRGRTWNWETFTLNDLEAKIWLDNTWGLFVYWELKGQWYKCRMVSELFSLPEYDIDVFGNKKVIIKTA